MAALGHKNIRRLDVAMDNSQRVGGIQAISNFDAEREQCLQFHGTVADDVLQRRAVEVLHDDERFAILLSDVVNGADHCCPGKNRAAAVINCFCRAYSDCGRERFESDLGETGHSGAIFAEA